MAKVQVTVTDYEEGLLLTVGILVLAFVVVRDFSPHGSPQSCFF